MNLDFYTYLLAVRDEYLDAGAPDVPFPERIKQDDDFSYMNASAFGNCPLQEAYKRLRIMPRFDVAEPGWLKHWGASGTALARIWQSAFQWRRQNTLIEHYIKDHVLRVKGYADAILPAEEWDYVWKDDGDEDALPQPFVLEIKFRVPGSKRDLRLSDCYQAMSYAHAVDTIRMGVLIVDWGDKSTGGATLWTLEPETATTFTAVNQQGRVHPAPWNRPSKVSYDALREEVTRHLRYLSEPLAFPMDIPIKDPYNATDGYHCIEWEVYPSKQQAGIARNGCGVGCHFADADQQITVHRNADGTFSPEATLLF